MANYKFSSEILDSILDRAGEPTDGTSDFESQSLQYLNRAYRGLWEGGQELGVDVSEIWWWMRGTTEGTLTLLPMQSGGATVLNNNTAVTLDATITPSMVGYKMRFGANLDVYTITAHTAGTAAVTLDSGYTAASGTDTWKAWKTDYALATDLLTLTMPFRIYREGIVKIKEVTEPEFQDRFPFFQLDWGYPTAFCFIGTQTVRFNKGGGQNTTDYIRVDYTYLPVPADLTDSASEEPLVPLQYRHILADWGTAMVLADKDDDRAAFYVQAAQAGAKAMSREHRRRILYGSSDFAKIKPRSNPVLRKDVRTETGLLLE